MNNEEPRFKWEEMDETLLPPPNLFIKRNYVLQFGHHPYPPPSLTENEKGKRTFPVEEVEGQDRHVPLEVTGRLSSKGVVEEIHHTVTVPWTGTCRRGSWGSGLLKRRSKFHTVKRHLLWGIMGFPF